MSASSESRDDSQLSAIKEKLKEYDYVRFTLVDLMGKPKAKLVPARNALDFIKSGINFYAGLNALGPNCDLVFPKEVQKMSLGNIKMAADLDTLHPVPWLGNGKYKTAQIFIEPSPSLQGETERQIRSSFSRVAAKNLLSELDAEGYYMKSGIECEYILTDGQTGEPVFSEHLMFHSTTLLTKFEDWFTEVEKNVYGAGVNLETLQTEYAPGQMEFCTAPEVGIKTADNLMILKQGLREMALKRGLEANFMAKPSADTLGSGCHFSFSLLDKKTGKNAFYDESTPDKLSQMAKHWIGGLIKHSKALTALCCPTTNCYNRLHTPWVPDTAYWGLQDRASLIRVKVDGQNGTYMENRLPSCLVNPYLMMCGTLAAGLDGIKNKIPCPEPGKEGSAPLPYSLEEAIEALNEDEVLKKALGEKLVDWFVEIKNTVDLKAIEGITDKAKKLEIEKKMYAKTC